MTFKITEEVLHVAGNILCIEGLTIEEQIKLIVALYKNTHSGSECIDRINGVTVCEDLANTYTIDSFMKILPWDKEISKVHTQEINSIKRKMRFKKIDYLKEFKLLKERKDIVEAFINGKKIEMKGTLGWVPVEDPRWYWDRKSYRIAPEPTTRPYTLEELSSKVCTPIKDISNGDVDFISGILRNKNKVVTSNGVLYREFTIEEFHSTYTDLLGNHFNKIK